MPYVPLNYRSNQNTKKIINGPFVLFDAKPFDVICFLGNECPASIINAASYYLIDRPILRETLIGGQSIIMDDRYDLMSHISKFKRMIQLIGKPKEIYQSIEINRKSGGLWR